MREVQAAILIVYKASREMSESSLKMKVLQDENELITNLSGTISLFEFC